MAAREERGSGNLGLSKNTVMEIIKREAG